MFIKKLIPTYWLFLLKSYLKNFVFFQAGFIALFFLLSAKELLLFASNQANYIENILFAIYQIPLALPLTLPFSLLFSSILFIYRGKASQEFTAFRSLGLSYSKLFLPLFTLFAFVFLFSLLAVSEITPYSLEKSKKMVHENTSKYPLLMLKRKDLIKYPDLSISLESSEKNHAKKLMIIHRDQKKNRLSLFQAEDLSTDKKQLIGKNINIISYIIKENSSPSLFIENEKRVSMDKVVFSKRLKKSKLKKTLFTLPMRSLLIKKTTDPYKNFAIDLEILRRFSLALIATSFALLGLTTCLSIFRKQCFIIGSLSFLTLLTHFSAKHMSSTLLTGSFFYLFPSLFLIVYSIYLFSNNSRRAQ